MVKCPECGKMMPAGGTCPNCGYKAGGGKGPFGQELDKMGKQAPPAKKKSGKKKPPPKSGY